MAPVGVAVPSARMPRTDILDTILAQWTEERPDLDCSPIAVMGRVARVARMLESFYQQSFEPFGLSPSEFWLLAELRRVGEPHQLTPTELRRTLIRSSGGITKVLDRLEREGLLKRRPDASDRRGSLVQLTAKGRRLIDKALTAHIANEHELLAPMPLAERAALADLLRELSLVFETWRAERGIQTS